MAEVIWTEPALQELDAIAEYIALDNPAAASHLVQNVFDKTERLENFPNPDGFLLSSPIRYTGR